MDIYLKLAISAVIVVLHVLRFTDSSAKHPELTQWIVNLAWQVLLTFIVVKIWLIPTAH